MGKKHASQYANFGWLHLSSFKFSTKVWERNMLVNTPILDGYKILDNVTYNLASNYHTYI